MLENIKTLPFRLANLLYKYAFPIYKPIYFFYKQKSDKKKLEYLSNLITPGMTVLDIGANIGFYSTIFSKLVGKNGKVFAFEPDSLNFKHLSSTTSKFNNIIIENAAIGDSSGKIKLFHSKNLNVDHHTYDNGKNRTFSEIRCIALDDYFHKNEKIDFIKIDIQGFDLYAIKGMMKTIKRSDNMKMIGEFWPYGLNKAGIYYKDYLKLLDELKIEVTFLCSENDIKNFEKNMNCSSFYTDFLGKK
ncbi:FkbM family methyltransferase [bacterium]|nr:FkbM family methyltransferase [bacterium]